jgi:hypothetical protein
MAKTVSAEMKKFERADWDSLVIEKAANGFKVCKKMDWKPGMKMPPAEPLPFLASGPDAAEMASEYVEKCLGVKESKAEEKGEKY